MSAAAEIAKDESRNWDERIRATAELEHKKVERRLKRRERQRNLSPEKKRQYITNYYQKQMTEIFESLEWHLFESLQKADGYVARMNKDASACQIPASFAREFIQTKLIDMIDQIAEQREAKKNAL